MTAHASSVARLPGSGYAPTTAQPNELPLSLRFGWGIGTLGPVTLLYVVNFALLFFMTNLLGIGAATAGALIFGARIFDLAFDLGVGALSDRTVTRWGRRRPWMFAGGLLSAAGCVMLFNVPAAVAGVGRDASSRAPLVWVAIALMVYFAGYSMFNVPYMAMPAEMTASSQERTRLMSLRVSFVALSGLVGIAFANWLVAFFGGGLSAYGATASIMAAISLAAMMYSVVGTASAHATRRTPAVPDLKGAILSVLSNRPFGVLIFAKLMLLLSLSAITTTMYYVVVQIMHRTPGVLSLYGIANNLGIVAALPLWAWLGKRFSKQMVFAIAILAGVPLSLSWLLTSPAEPIWVFCVRALLTGVAAGGSLVMGQSLLPDTMEYDFRRTGLRREGVFAAIYSFVEKASFAAGPLIVGALLGVFGYVSSKAGAPPVLQSKGALTGIYIGVAVVPAVAAMIAALSLRFYNLNEAELCREATPYEPTP
jgi:GPH family glycoside/pentoside/hexuronide:cation symporter